LFGFYLGFPENLSLVDFWFGDSSFCAFVASILYFCDCFCLPEDYMIHPACCLLVLF
jgi:hypothetical protein